MNSLSWLSELNQYALQFEIFWATCHAKRLSPLTTLSSTECAQLERQTRQTFIPLESRTHLMFHHPLAGTSYCRLIMKSQHCILSPCNEAGDAISLPERILTELSPQQAWRDMVASGLVPQTISQAKYQPIAFQFA